MSALGFRLKILRKEKGLSQIELAKRLKVHLSQVAKYETSYTVPSIEILKKYADYFDISIDFLAYGESKELQKRTRIADTELLYLFQKANGLNKHERENLKWAIQALIDKQAHHQEALR